MTNNFTMLIRFFAKDGRPVSRSEWEVFWYSCSVKERDYFRNVNLATGELGDGPETKLQFVEKTCSYCCKIVWDSLQGPYTNETHNRIVNGKVVVSLCNMAGKQYWQYEDGSVEIRDADGEFLNVVS